MYAPVGEQKLLLSTKEFSSEDALFDLKISSEEKFRPLQQFDYEVDCTPESTRMFTWIHLQSYNHVFATHISSAVGYSAL